MTSATQTAAQHAIETADSYLQNAVLPTYSELLAVLRITKEFIDGHSFVEVGQATNREFKALGVVAGTLLTRHDRTMAGDFR